MVTSRALLERNAETLAMCAFGAEESPRSIQLYGVDPDVMGKAVRMVADDDMAGSHRPQHGMSGAQGHAQGVGSGAALEA